MSASEMGRGMEEKGREDMEEGIAPDVNMNDEETKAEANDNSFLVSENNQDAKASENVDLPTENNDVTSVGLLTDKDGSIDNQTADDANINSTVDRLDGNGKYLNLESVDNKDKGLESVSDKTDNNASVDVIFKEHFCSKSDGSFLIAADKTLAEMEVTNGEKEEKLDDASVVVASVNELSGTKDDGGHVRNKRECAAAERSPDIKAENDEMVGKFDAASVVDASADQLSGSKSDGSLVDPLNQLECAASDERPSEIKAVDDLKSEKLHDASFVDVANMLSGSKNDGIGSHVHRFDPPECAAADERLSEMKAKNDEKGEKLDDASVFHLNANELSGIKNDGSHKNSLVNERSSETKDDDERGVKLNNGVTDMELTPERDDKESKPEVDVRFEVSKESSNLSFLFEPPVAEGDESGTEDEQAAFAKEVENFYKERNIEFKHPKFYKEDLNLLKLWRAVIKLGGYDEVTSCKLWRQVGESFNPPKTCTTVSWTFRIFYEKALLEYEKHRISNGELPLRDCSHTEPSRMESQAAGSQALGSGRARRDAAARAMQGWHSKRLLGSGEVCHPIIKEKNSSCTPKNDRQIKNIGLLKRKKPSTVERTIQVAKMKGANSQLDTMIIDIGPPADWVKINVQRTIDCFEVYALVPGLLREEVHVQSDPAGRLVISGQPEQLDNPWGVTPFKKVVSLPSRIDPHQTSAVVTLHGQLFVRVPFEHSDM